MKKYVTLFLFCSGIFSAFSQVSQTSETDKERNKIIDELLQDNMDIDELIASLSNFHLLYLSANYNNKTYFSGRDIGIDQYNIKPQITYMNSLGIYASLYGIYYSGLEPKWDVTTATLGYGKNFGKNKIFKYHASFSKYFYNNEDDNILSNDLSAGISIQNKKRTIGTQLITSYLFGNDQSFQIASSSFYTLTILKTKKTKLEFKPQLNIIAGQQTIELAQSYTRMGQVFTTYIENDVFDLINTQLNFPLKLNTSSFDFEVGYNINFPSAIGSETDLKNTSFINFSVGYLINL